MAKLPMPFSNPSTYPGHGGIDYGQGRGTPVRAEGSGYVDWSGYYSARGGYAKFITFDNGERRGYYHFDREQGYGRGRRVQYGEIFAYVGGLGQYSTGPHLHHEVWRNGSIIRPPAYWNHVDRNRYVGDGSGSGGGEVDMPLTTAEINQIAAASAKAVWERLVTRTGGSVKAIQELADIKTLLIDPVSGQRAVSERTTAIRTTLAGVAQGVSKINDTLLAGVALTPATIKVIADATAAQVLAGLPSGGGGGTVAIDYDKIATVVREKFTEEPLR